MIEAWKDQQLQWLARLYEVRVRELDTSIEFEEFPEPTSSQQALLEIFMNALDETIAPSTAAQKIANWVISVPDVDKCYDVYNAYSNMLGVLFGGARQLSERKNLKTLADLTIELANQPDASNTKQTPMSFEQGSVVIRPGEKIEFPGPTGTHLWSSLPNFESSIQEDLSAGPTQFFTRYDPMSDDVQQVYRQAEGKYANFSTYAALIAKQRPPDDSPLSSCLRSAFAVFAFIEHGPDSNRGRFANLSVRAAAAWIVLAGEEMIGMKSRQSYLSGSLWEAEGGTNMVDVPRLKFWKRRFRQLIEEGQLVSDEAVSSAEHAEAELERLIASQG